LITKTCEVELPDRPGEVLLIAPPHDEPPGSYLVIGDSINATASHDEARRRYSEGGAVPYHLRSPDQIIRFFDGLELVDPGVVPVTRWRPDPIPFGTQLGLETLGGVARKKLRPLPIAALSIWTLHAVGRVSRYVIAGTGLPTYRAYVAVYLPWRRAAALSAAAASVTLAPAAAMAATTAPAGHHHGHTASPPVIQPTAQCLAASSRQYHAVPWAQQRLAPDRVWNLTMGAGQVVAGWTRGSAARPMALRAPS